MGLLDALREDGRLIATPPLGGGYQYWLLPAGYGEILAMPFGAALIEEIRARAGFEAQLQQLEPSERGRALEAWAEGREREVAWVERLARTTQDLPHLQRIAWRQVRGCAYPDVPGPDGVRTITEAWLVLTLGGVDGWTPAPGQLVERAPVEALEGGHLAQIGQQATLGALGALERAVWLPRGERQPGGRASDRS